MAIKKQTFMKGILIIMVSQVLIKILGFIYRIVLTNFKQFGDVGNSYYGSGYTVYTLILALATMGIPNTISKLVSEKQAIGDKRGAHRIFRTAMVLFTFIAFIFATLLFLGSGYIANNILSNPGVKYTLMSLSPAIVFVAMSAVLRGYFVGMQNMMEYSKAQVIEQVVNSIFSIVFVAMLLGSTPEIMAAGSTLATTVSTSIAFLYMFNYYNKNKKDIWKEIALSQKFSLESRSFMVKKLISYVIPISFGSIVVAMSGIIDSVTVINGLMKIPGYTIQKANEMFGIILGKVDILNSVPLSINVAFSVALVPFVSAAVARGNINEAKKKINFSIKISSIIAFPCTAGILILAPQIFNLLFPNSPSGAYLLQIQSFMILFAVLAQTLYGSLHGLGKIYVPGLCLFTGIIFKYIVNVVYIPIYGISVPAFTTVLYNGIACIIAFIFLFIYLKEKPDMNSLFIKPFLATLMMSLVVILVNRVLLYIKMSEAIATIVVILIAIASYMVFVVIFKALKEEEIMQIPYGNKICQVLRKYKKI